MIVALAHNGVIVKGLCSTKHFAIGFRLFLWKFWPRGWKRPEVAEYLHLMALANEPEEKVWRDWQQAIMMTALSGPEGMRSGRG